MDNREAIIKTIDKIAQLSKQPGNEWLHRELQTRWGCANPICGNNDMISNIERYLAIDYTIDEMATQIDYSFVKDEVLRLKLEADWREMLRYRCGVRKHEPDFLEFCRYANLQAEGIVNHYCYTKYSTEEELRNKCNGYFEEAVDARDPKFYCKVRGEYVSYINKLNLITVETSLSRNVTYSLSQEIYQARNVQSHRSLLSYDKDEKSEKLQMWLSKSPYEEVEKILIILVNTIRNAIFENNTK